MALDGSLESTRFPYLPLGLTLENRSVQVEVLLDTGFDGDVAVPPGLVMNGEPPDDYLVWALADGSEVLAPAFLGRARLGPFPEFLVLS